SGSCAARAWVASSTRRSARRLSSVQSRTAQAWSIAMNVVESIKRQNQRRDPERLQLKYSAMRDSAFAFLRATRPLFYERLPRDALRVTAPLAWACGDLHLENFGTFKGDNRLVYFDLNDFDESALAPATIDLLRLLASVAVCCRWARMGE